MVSSGNRDRYPGKHTGCALSQSGDPDAFTATFLCDRAARGRHRYSLHPGSSLSLQAGYDGTLYARCHGSDRGHRDANRGHISLEQLKVMSAIERCRTAALGGHVARCENANPAYTQIAYNSCRNRHCPKCQGAAAREWLAAREAELLPVPYFHVVFSLPAQIADIAYQNKAAIYDILFKASAETLITIA